MSNSYKVSFKQLRQDNLGDLFEAFERALQALDIDFYLIGAVARDTWFSQNDIKALGTKDIDFAVMVSSQENYEALKNYLIKIEHFITSSSSPYTMFDTHGIQIDLLPFGSLEIEGKKIRDKTGFIRTNVHGFKEVYEEAVQEVNFENKHVFKVATLAGIAILKLISYDDRPEMRYQDVKDIATILEHYFDIEKDIIYEEHSDLFVEMDDLQIIAARALGRQMQKALSKDELLRTRILGILEKNATSAADSPVGLLLQSGRDTTIEYQTILLKEIINGIKESVDK